MAFRQAEAGLLFIFILAFPLESAAMVGGALDPAAANSVAPITITASRAARVAADRRAYDIKINPDLSTITAEEVVARLPGVITDLQGRLTILGQSSINYQVNGESVPAALALQIPAVQVERVEMITNPGADTKGASRVVINFVLRAPRSRAYGVARGKTDTLDRSELSLTLGRRAGRIDLTASLSLSRDPQARRIAYEQNFVAGPDAGLNVSRSSDSHIRQNQVQGYVAAAYEHGNWTYSLLGLLSDNPFRNAVAREERQASEGALVRQFTIDDDFTLRSHSGSISLGGQRKGHGQSKFNWSIAPRWNSSDSRSSQDLVGYDHPNFRGWETTRGEGGEVKLTMERGDTVAELLKAGVEAALDQRRAEYRTEGYGDPQTRFEYVHESASLYVTRQFSNGAFQALPGLRVEAARLRTRLSGAAWLENASPVRPLPSLHLVYALDSKTRLRASLSRRGGNIVASRYNASLRRTAYDTYSQGNPSLEVEDQWSLESSYEWIEGRRAITAAIYARRTLDGSQSYVDYLGDGNYLERFINVDRADRLGVSLNLKSNIGRKADLAIDLHVYQDDRRWALNGFHYDRKGTSYDVKLNGSYRFSGNSSAVLVMQYAGRESGLETQTSGRLSSSIKYVRDVGANVSLALEAVDFLSTRRRSVARDSPFFRSNSIVDQSRKAWRVTLSRSF